MKAKLLCTITLFSFLIFSSIAAAAAPTESNWQIAYKDNANAFFFDTSTVKNLGSSYIVRADLKTEISASALQSLIEKYKDQYDVSTWNQIKYIISTTDYNAKDGTLLTKNHRFYDEKNMLVVTIAEESKTTVPADSVQSKVYDAIFQWLYEN